MSLPGKSMEDEELPGEIHTQGHARYLWKLSSSFITITAKKPLINDGRFRQASVSVDIHIYNRSIIHILIQDSIWFVYVHIVHCTCTMFIYICVQLNLYACNLICIAPFFPNVFSKRYFSV